jgi:hypothetical protein
MLQFPDHGLDDEVFTEDHASAADPQSSPPAFPALEFPDSEVDFIVAIADHASAAASQSLAPELPVCMNHSFYEWYSRRIARDTPIIHYRLTVTKRRTGLLSFAQGLLTLPELYPQSSFLSP